MTTVLRRSLSTLTLLASALSAQALSFNFVHADNMDTRAIAGFQEAGTILSSLFTDKITVNIEIQYAYDSAGFLAGCGSYYSRQNYSDVINALRADKTSIEDSTATRSFDSRLGQNDLYINYHHDNPNGIGSSTPWLDNDGSINNQKVTLTQANAKALGFDSNDMAPLDAFITFNSAYTFDFNPNDGIAPGTFDYVGIAIHEIGHALGFESGADETDWAGGGSLVNVPESAYRGIGTAYALDLFRYSQASLDLKAIDLTADTREKYFSIDGGTTKLTTFSTGSDHGDHYQASHWKDQLGIGLMDPTSAEGEVKIFTPLDILAFDVIGWDVAGAQPPATPVPEPSTYGLMGAGALAGLGLFRRFRRRR